MNLDCGALPSEVSLPAAEQLLAVLVLYNRRLEESETFRSLTSALAHCGAVLDLAVYDNSTHDAGWDGRAEHSSWRIHYIRDASNPGVSAAYLAGARIARQLKKQWLLLLDQDTRFDENALDTYFAAMRAHPDVRLFAPILQAGARTVSPCRYRLFRGRSPRRVEPGLARFGPLSVLNSGMCVDVAAYFAAGAHNPAIPLDFSDHDFVGRFARREPTFVIVNTTARHALSAGEAASVSNRLRRFDAYCVGAGNLPNRGTGRVLLRMVAFGRAVRLAVTCRDSRFLRTFFRRLMGGYTEPRAAVSSGKKIGDAFP